LEYVPSIDEAIKIEERRYTALKNAEEVQTKPHFGDILLPSLNINGIKALLSQSLPDLGTQALKKIRKHFENIGEGGELWIEQGIRRIYKENEEQEEIFCPFCAQNLKQSSLIGLYQTYFSDVYSNLIRQIDNSIREIQKKLGGDAIAEFQEKVTTHRDLYRFWIPLCDIPKSRINTSEIAKSWQEVRKIILDALKKKKASPLERFELDREEEDKIKSFQDSEETLEAYNQELLSVNKKIEQIKHEASSGNITEISDKLYRLKATKKRYSSDIAALCDDYLKEKESKRQTEEEKIETRKILDDHRNDIFPKYQDSINNYLSKFNTNFQIGSVTPTNPRGKPSCIYCLIINDTEVPLEPDDHSKVSPTFKTTLSSGDRSTLALSFFFAFLEQDPAISQRIVLLDDPVTSLDDCREISTTHEIQSFVGKTAQVIVLSHDKPFLCKIWESSDKENTATLEVKRTSSGSSSIEKWNIHSDILDDHDIRHEELRRYYEENIGDKEKISRNIRFVLEKYCRVSWPEYYPPGFLLGKFEQKICRSLTTRNPILDQDEYQEFSNLVKFANKFHHETNPTWREEITNIRDQELQGFVKRTLKFIKRRRYI
jgi:wobble nucleotide-excising tRNase